MLLFHGTTLDNALKIQKEGFSYEKRVWNCSLDEVYFYEEDYFWDEMNDDATFENMLDRAIREALDQARIGLAIENPSNYIPAVLIFDSDLMSNKDRIVKDTSCPNMEDRAVALENPDMNGLVAIVFTDVDEKVTRFHQLSMFKDNPFLEMPKLTSLDKAVLDSISENLSYSEIIDELCSVNFKIKWFKNLDHRSGQVQGEREISPFFYAISLIDSSVIIGQDSLNILPEG